MTSSGAAARTFVLCQESPRRSCPLSERPRHAQRNGNRKTVTELPGKSWRKFDPPSGNELVRGRTLSGRSSEFSSSGRSELRTISFAEGPKLAPENSARESVRLRSAKAIDDLQNNFVAHLFARLAEA